MKKLFLLLSLPILLFSCSSDGKDNKFIPDSVGKPYEIFVISDPEMFRGSVGDSIKNSLEQEVHMINNAERSLQLVNIPPANFKGLTKKHRNIVIFQVGENYPITRMYTVNDEYAKPQMITVLQAPTTAQLEGLITEMRDSLKKQFENEELARFAVKAAKVTEPKSVARVKDMFNIDLKLPKGFVYRNAVEPDFLWISYELPEASQGVIIYEYPYDGKPLTDASIIEARNKFISNVPGELPNSFMTTSDMFDPETESKVINGNVWQETRGFWRVENDFMGGPFVNYTIIDEENNRVVGIDWYVYSPNPNKGQRNYLRQLEGIMMGAKL